MGSNACLSQLISLRPSHILKLTVNFLAEMVSMQIIKADHSLESKTDEKTSRSHENLWLFSPFTCYFRNSN